MNALTEVTQGRQQVPPASGSNDPQEWEKSEEELRKSLPKIAEEAKKQPEHSPVRLRVMREAEHPPGVDGQTTPFLQEISECHFGAGWITYTSATGATEQPVHA